MPTHNVKKYAALHAIGAALYVAFIACFMNTVPELVGEVPEHIAATMFLLVFVISAAVMGLLVFGRPILWYLEGAKQEAVSLVLYTVGFLAGIAVLLFLFLLSRAF